MQLSRRPEVRARRRAPLGRHWKALVAGVLLVTALAPAPAVHARSTLGTPQGFGSWTTGGTGGLQIFVTSLADAGPGTLREAVERPEPAEVRFLVSGTIVLKTQLRVRSQKTINGRGPLPVTISNKGLLLAQSNVIVDSLRFEGFGDPTVTDDPEDAIEIRGARRVWINHNEFSSAADKAIQVTSGTDITVSGNHFHAQSQVFQVGCYACPDGAAIRLSMYDNYFEGGDRGYRMPTVNYGYVHAWNNYLTTAIALTNTHSVGVVRDAMITVALEQGAIDDSASLPVVGEIWDGPLNDINGMHVQARHVRQAIASATTESVAQGNVGGGTGAVCHAFKGGIGSSSRRLPQSEGGHTVGVLVQANQGRRERLLVNGVPVGRELTPDVIPKPTRGGSHRGGSIIGVAATDAPLLPHQCRRVAQRMALGVARTGGTGEDSSGDPLFYAVVEATEEAIVNALLAAETMTGKDEVVAYRLDPQLLRDVLFRYRPT